MLPLLPLRHTMLAAITLPAMLAEYTRYMLASLADIELL